MTSSSLCPSPLRFSYMWRREDVCLCAHGRACECESECAHESIFSREAWVDVCRRSLSLFHAFKLTRSAAPLQWHWAPFASFSVDRNHNLCLLQTRMRSGRVALQRICKHHGGCKVCKWYVKSFWEVIEHVKETVRPDWDKHATLL